MKTYLVSLPVGTGRDTRKLRDFVFVRMDTRTVPKKCIQKNIYKKKDTINKKE
jgi:hypothetical protein